jgi:hypothetical protein
MGKLVFPGEWIIYNPILTVADVKFWCDESHGYPN